MHRHRTLHLLLLAGLIGGPAVMQGAVPAAADLRLEPAGLSFPDAADFMTDAADASLDLATKPVRKHRYKGRRTASKARSSGKRKSGAKSRHGRKGGGVRKTGYASKAKAKKRKKFKSRSRTKRGRSRGRRGR